MAKKLLYNYTFDASAQTIVVKGLYKLRTLQLITNVTDGIIIYNFADSAKGGTTSYDSTNDETTITLEHDTTAMSDSDELQIFFDEQDQKIEASESLLDPVHKFRVSNPENLIDTDFEYGLQPTKWETIELVNNIPSTYTRAPGTSIGGISQVNTTSGTDEVTVTCTINHDLAVGNPIEIQGTSSRTVNGKYIITAVPSTTTFVFRASAEQATTANVKTAYTTIIPGAFFTASNIKYEDSRGIETDNASPSTLTIETEYNHGIVTSTSLYLTNTVGKKSISIANTGTTAPDGDPYVDVSADTFYLPNHGLYTNQTVFLSVGSGGSIPTAAANYGKPNTTGTNLETIYNAIVTECDTTVSTFGADHSRLYMSYPSSSLYAYYTTSSIGMYPREGAVTADNDYQIQYLTYGDYYSTSTYDYMYLFGGLSGNTYYGEYRWYNYGEGNSILYTGSPVDIGQYYSRVNGSGPTTLNNLGYMYIATPHSASSFTNYIIQIKQIPDPSSVVSQADRQYHWTNGWRNKRPNTSSYSSYRTIDNTWNNAGDGWWYTYLTTMHTLSFGSHYLKFNITLENRNWSTFVNTGDNRLNIGTYNGDWYLGAYKDYYGSNGGSTRGEWYDIEILFALDEDSNSYAKYGPSGSTLSYTTFIQNVIDEIKAVTTPPNLSNVGLNTLTAQVVNSNRIKLRTTAGSSIDFDSTGKAPLVLETAQTTGVVDDYYSVTGVTSTTVSIGSSNQIVSRELTFADTDISTYESDYYINISTGHGLFDTQKLVFDKVSGADIPGLNTGETYYAIATNDKYLRLGISTINAQIGINSITGVPGSSGSYTLTIPSISGRVAAAGTVTVSETSKLVSGQDTKFTSAYSVGDKFRVVGLGTYEGFIENEVASVVSDTSMYLREVAGITTVGVPHFLDTKVNVRADGTFIHRPFDGGVEITAGTSPNSKIIRQTRKYFRYQSGKGIQCSMAINFNPYKPARLVQGSGTTVTVTTEYPHNLTAGDTIKFRGASDSAYNGTSFTVSNPTTFTFQYTAGSTVSQATPTGFMEYTINSYSGSAVRAGLFDDQNGFFFEYDGSSLYAVRRSSVQQLSGTANVTFGSNVVLGTNTRFSDQLSVGNYIVIRGQTYRVTAIKGQDEINIQPKYRGTSNSGVVVTITQDTRVAQSSWNIDTADGSGPSGYTLDINSIQMVYLDYSWYGAGKIRFGMKDTYGHVKYMHEFIHNNRLNEAYMRTGNVPARYEIENTTDTPTFVPSLFHWGTSVIMDGGFDDDDSYLFTASGNSLSFTNGDSDSADTTAAGSIYRQRIYGSYSNYYLRLTFASADASKFTNGVSLYTTDEALDGQAVDFTSYSGSSFYVYIYLSSGWSQPGVYPIVPSGTTVSIGAPSSGASDDVDLNSLIPLISVRLAPSVDNNLIGELGERDIVNRMQLKLQELGVSVSHDSTISVVLNGALSNLDHLNVGTPSLSQYTAHESGDTIQGGTTIYQFRASGGAVGIRTDGTEVRSVASQSFDLSPLIDLGNSILGGDGVFPDGPDVVTICTSVIDTASVSGNSPYQVSSRISWSESQA